MTTAPNDHLFTKTEISFEPSPGEICLQPFEFLFTSRSNKSVEDFMRSPEGLALIARWPDQQTPGHYKGLPVQSYYKTEQMKGQLGYIIKLQVDTALDPATSFYKRYPYLSPKEKLSKQQDEAYKRTYAGKKQANLATLLFKQVEHYHRGAFEAPDLSTKLALLYFLYYYKRLTLQDAQSQLNINEILLYLKDNDYKILRAVLEKRKLLTILKKEGTSQEIHNKFKADELGYVNYGVLPPVIRFQIKQELERLELKLGDDFTIEGVIAELKKHIQERAERKAREISKNGFVVPSYHYVSTLKDLEDPYEEVGEGVEAGEGVEDKEERNETLAWDASYAQSSPEEYPIAKQKEDPAKAEAFKKETLGVARATTKQPIPGYLVALPGYTEAHDSEGALAPGFVIVGQWDANDQANAFFPSASYWCYERVMDPNAMFEDMEEAKRALQKLNFYVRNTMGIGGSFSFERGRLSFFIPVEGKESKEKLAFLEQEFRKVFGIEKSSPLVRRNSPSLRNDIKIVGTGDDKLLQPYYCFEFEIGPIYFFRRFMNYRHEQQAATRLQLEEKGGEERQLASPTVREMEGFHSNLKSLSSDPEIWDSIFKYCQRYPTEAYKTIAVSGGGGTGTAHVFETPLHWICFAAFKGKITKAKLLDFLRLPEVAQHINIENGWGYKPHDEGIIRGMPPELFQVLVDFGANVQSLTTEPYSDGKAYRAERASSLDLCLAVIEREQSSYTGRERSRRSDFLDQASSSALSSVESRQKLSNLRRIKQILEENGAKQYMKYARRVGTGSLAFYEKAAHPLNQRTSLPALISQRCASAILTDEHKNVLHVHFPTLINAIGLAEQQALKITDIVLPDTFSGQGVAGMTLLEVACVKGQVELVSTLLSQLKREQAKQKQGGEVTFYATHIEGACCKLLTLMAKDKAAAADILYDLLKNYPEYFQHFAPSFQPVIGKIVFNCSSEESRLFSTYFNALQSSSDGTRHAKELETIFKELKSLHDGNRSAATATALAAMLYHLLAAYPNYYQLYTPDFKALIKKLVFEYQVKEPTLYEAFRAAITCKQAAASASSSSQPTLFNRSSVASGPSSGAELAANLRSLPAVQPQPERQFTFTRR
ncbi:MAG TPA: hypothetical protein VLH77_05045 [Gammaproteobacteria bacterium]|nr:hypothetical protein [Gammaproteobacteria bacterium]